jgi:ATP phosphoribosyltransferase
MSARLRIAVQKSGRLAEKSLDLIEDAGLRLIKGANDLLYRIENAPIDLLRVRDDDIPTFVADGVADLGIVGRNVLEERNGASPASAGPIEIMPLGFGRCDLKIATTPGFAYDGPQSLEGQRIATSYPRVLSRFLRENEVQAEIVIMRGAVEVAPLETILRCEAVLIRSANIMDAGLARLADSVTQRFRGVSASRGAKYVMMNAPRTALPRISEILPGAEAPTVTPLAGRDDAVAVHAVCQESVFWETLEQLKAAGASAILVLPIEKMM